MCFGYASPFKLGVLISGLQKFVAMINFYKKKVPTMNIRR